MVEALIFIGVIVMVVGGGLGGALWLTRAKPGRPEIMLVEVTGGREAAHLVSERLRVAGIKAYVRNVGDTYQSTNPYGYEVWVLSGDEKRAREALGL